jgi:hypothetical protein
MLQWIKGHRLEIRHSIGWQEPSKVDIASLDNLA